MLLTCGAFTSQEARIITECSAFARRLPLLLQAAFGLTFDRLPAPVERKFIFQILQEKKLARIIDGLGFDPQKNPVHHINFALLEDDACRAAFLRGAFLCGGSVIDPAKGYHLELACSHAQASRELAALLADMGYPPKQITRGGSQVTYFKASGRIERLLECMGAASSAQALTMARAEKQLRNGVNRRVNCDSANLNKTVDAAQEQLEAIRRLYDRGMVETLSPPLKETIVLRETYPELTLSQLAEEFEPPITKSCLVHRLRKLIRLAGNRESCTAKG